MAQAPGVHHITNCMILGSKCFRGFTVVARAIRVFSRINNSCSEGLSQEAMVAKADGMQMLISEGKLQAHDQW